MTLASVGLIIVAIRLEPHAGLVVGDVILGR
jgi:hypothetical protein